MNEQETREQDHDLSLVEYGTRQDVVALSKRIRAMMPGGDKLTDAEALAAAQYAMLTDANLFRGEIYVYADDRGKLTIVDGYKLLVRWARRQCQFYDKYEPLTTLPEGAIGFTCYLLRDDARGMLKALTEMGATWQEAYETVATSAVGVVAKNEMWSTRYNKPIPPPKGWTWEQVAEKRALKNAINRAYGAPSPREMADQSWQVNGVKTIPSDWAEATPEMRPQERARLAEMTAIDREREPDDRPPDEIIAAGIAILRGEPDEADWDAPEEPQERKPSGTHWWTNAINTLLDANLAQNGPNAAAMLKKAELPDGCGMDVVEAWGYAYRTARDAGKTSDQAASVANEDVKEGNTDE